MTHRRHPAGIPLLVAMLLGTLPALAGQELRGKKLYFGDAHWHSCLSQDAGRDVSPDDQYASMLYDYGLDFSLESEHAEAASAPLHGCEPYLPDSLGLIDYSGEDIADAMKEAADNWYGVEHDTSAGPITFVPFPGYEWANDARCWMAGLTGPAAYDVDSDSNTPGHINYFFDRTTGWNYHDDVWEPGNDGNLVCAAGSAVGIGYYSGSKDHVDELLGQLIHQRDDPGRDYDLMIQYNHPAGSVDEGGSSDHLAKWFYFEHSSSACSVAEGGTACRESQCEAVRRAYGVTSVEWYALQEASIGSTEHHAAVPGCTLLPPLPLFNVTDYTQECFHESFHAPDRYVSSRGLREGFDLAFTGGSDNHGGRRFAPTGFGNRGAGSKSLTVVAADASTREAIWDGLTRRRTYALSRFREGGPVHKGRVDFYTLDPLTFNTPRIEHGMGEHVEALHVGTRRNFTITAAPEQGSRDVYPRELRLYRVAPDTPLSQRTEGPFWLDDVAGDPGKLGELLGKYPATPNTVCHEACTNLACPGQPCDPLEHTFEDIIVRPGDAVFATVTYSDDVWVDDFFDTQKKPLDENGDGVVDEGKQPFLHTDNATWARTTPIFFDARQERATGTSVCSTVTFSGSGSEAPEDGPGGLDLGLAGDAGVLPVAIPDGYDVEWNRYRFTTPQDSEYVDLSFYTGSDDHDPGTLVAVRIDGRLVLSGRGSIDWANDTLVTRKGIPFALKRGIHTVELHSDDQEYANGDNDPDFHCDDHDGVAAFLDAIAFHKDAGAQCSDHTPPTITCPAGIALECNTLGGVSASDPRIVTFLGGAVAVDHIDNAQDVVPDVTTDAPALFGTGTTTVTFTAMDEGGNTASCTADVVVADTTPPSLAGFALAPAQIGPPRHDLKTITVPRLVATDICDAAPAIRCSVVSDEAPNGTGDGDTPVDIVFNGQDFTTQGTGEQVLSTTGGSGTFTLKLRAERSAAGTGRTYTASCVAVDGATNSGAAQSATVFVPKCASGKGKATGVCVGMDREVVKRRPGGIGISGVTK
ncbi:MAG TPA: HYR domain-containing protein [Verrucomicrobiae bacterium]|nr:HYR domain-containing protein [Verrucomicrobiae bacterium]